MNHKMTKQLPKNGIFVFSLILILIASTIGGAIPVQTFAGIKSSFDILPEHMSWAFKLNFIGMALSSLIAGPLLDYYGRKKILICCMIFLLIANLNCLFSTNFIVFISSSLFMGIAKSLCGITCITMIFDKYKNNANTKEKNNANTNINSLISLVKGSVLVAQIITPYILIWLIKTFDWKLVFETMLFLNIIGLVLSIKYIIPPSYIKNKEKNIVELLKSYKMFITSFRFIGNLIIFSFPFVTISLIMSNSSILLIGPHLTIMEFSEYGTILFITSSLAYALSHILVKKVGLEVTSCIGLSSVIISITTMLLCVNYGLSDTYVFASLIGCAAGGVLMHGFFIEAIKLFPDRNATAVAFSSILINATAARAISITNLLFDNTMKPSFAIISLLFAIILIIYIILNYKNKQHIMSK